MICYTDGAFDQRIGRYGYGIVMIDGDGVRKYAGGGSDENVKRSRNIGAELIAAMAATSMAIKDGHDEVTICYDYLGVENWATGGWKARSAVAVLYKKYMTECKKKIDIRFKKVKAHAGDEYNELADRLAKQGIDNY